MRTGYKGGWLDESKLVGISLGADYCAEHEWGIGGLKKFLGIDSTKEAGLPRRTISRHDNVKLFESKGAVALLCMASWRLESMEKIIKAKGFKEALPMDLPRTELGTAWSEDDFGIHATGKNAEMVRELYTEFQKNNIALWLGGGHVFENAGLAICVADRVPAEGAKLLKDGDIDADKLKAASDATGIIGRLKAADKGYFACSPRWLTDKGRKSAHPVIYWLNPMEQNRNNYGWFTVEELDQWIAGTGPVPMAAVSTK